MADTPKSTQHAEGSGIAQAQSPGAIATVITNIFRGTTAEQHALRNRQAMLQLVRNFWVKGVLEQSLHGAAMLELGMEYRPDAVERPWGMVLQVPDTPDETLPHSTRILPVFDRIGGALLILGEPGSGKTTTLLELARDAIARAEADLTWPIPVVFNLSTWSGVQRGRRGRAQEQSFADWLMTTLNTQYHVSTRIARAWVENDALLLLLDGLDEVPAGRRDGCVAAINAFRQEHGFALLVVCSRSADYAALTHKLQLQGAVVLQPLTRAQIDAYLDGAGVELNAVRATLERDPILQGMAQSPLMLSIMTLAYRGADMSALHHLDTPEARREHLLEAYVQKMFTRRSKAQPYTPEQTVRGLAWLAQQMTAHGQTVFLLENVQPDWLPEPDARWARRVAWWMGGLLFAVWGFLVSGLMGLLYPVLAGGLVTGLVAGLLGGLLGGPGAAVQVVERLDWSWRKAARGLLLGLLAGLVLGLGVGTLAAPTFDPPERAGLLRTLGLLLALLGGLVGALAGGLGRAAVAVRTAPNQGIRQTARYALLYALVAAPLVSLGMALGFRLAVGQGWTAIWWIEGLGVGLLTGLGARLLFGGRAVLLHYALRGALWRAGYLPGTWIRFFDHAADRILLRKVGGGYVFIHRLLQEHSAARALPPLPGSSPARALRALRRRQKTRLFLGAAGALILLSILASFAERSLVRDARGLVGFGQVYLGDIYANQGNYEAALAAYDRAIELDPQYAIAYHNRGYTYAEMGQYERAIADYDRAIELDPQYANAYHNRGNAYYQIGQYERAIADYDRAIELDPQYAIAYHNRGYTYAEMGQYERAIADYDRAIELDPQHATTYKIRGDAYDDLGQYERAIADYDRAIELDPQYANAYHNRGNAYYQIGQYERAIADYDRAIELNPQSAIAYYYNRGYTYAEMGQYERAIADYDRAIELDPQYANAYHNRGNAYYQIGQYERAIADYDRAIELNPQSAIAYYYNRGYTYAEMGQYERAIADYDRAIELDPQYANAYNNRGYTYAEMGQYERAIELDPRSDGPYYWRGKAYQALGRMQEARADFEHILESSNDANWRAWTESALHELDATPTPGDDTP